jgi:hypothetical protein
MDQSITIPQSNITNVEMTTYMLQNFRMELLKFNIQRKNSSSCLLGKSGLRATEVLKIVGINATSRAINVAISALYPRK